MPWTPEQIATFHARYEARKAEEKVAQLKRDSASKNAYNKKRGLQFHKDYYQKNKEKYRKNQRKRLFGVSEEQWNTLFASQGNCCAICKTTDNGSKKHWSTDHDHATGKVRGILCHHCNLALGHFKDDSSRVRTAADYLDRFTQK